MLKSVLNMYRIYGFMQRECEWYRVDIITPRLIKRQGVYFFALKPVAILNSIPTDNEKA